MRKISLLLVLVLSVGSFSMACSDDAGEPTPGEDTSQEDPDTVDEPDTIDETVHSEFREDYSEPYAKAVCERIFSCCPFLDRDRATRLLGASGEFSTEEECLLLITDAVDAQLTDESMTESLESGRRRYQADKVDDCIREIEAASCGDGLLPRDAESACAQVFEAQVEEGGDCTEADECRVGNCLGVKRDNDHTITQVGTCQSTVPGDDGEECDAMGLFLGTMCTEENYCNLETFICQPKVEIGEACAENRECVRGAYCDESCKVQNTLGESCTKGSCDGQSYCMLAGYDDERNRCAPRKIVSVGDVCDEGASDSQCQRGSYCSGNEPARCVDLRNAQQVCVGIN